MRFRSPTDAPIRVASTSGHVTTVGPEWRELPEVLHYEAMTSGCLRDDTLSSPAPSAKPTEGSTGAIDYDAAYHAALVAMLQRTEAGDFTGSGMPNINAVSKLCGFAAKKGDVYRIFRAMKDEAGVTGGDDAGEDEA